MARDFISWVITRRRWACWTAVRLLTPSSRRLSVGYFDYLQHMDFTWLSDTSPASRIQQHMAPPVFWSLVNWPGWQRVSQCRHLTSLPWVLQCRTILVIRYMFIFAGNEPPDDASPSVVAGLDTNVTHFRSRAFAPTTNRTYTTHVRAYMVFCNMIGVNPVPVSQANLARYAAHLATKLSYTSIRQY